MQSSTRAMAAARTVVRSAPGCKVKYIKRRMSGTKTASLGEGEPQCRALLWEKAGVYVLHPRLATNLVTCIPTSMHDDYNPRFSS